MRLPRGFIASGVRAGIRKRRPDLAMIVAPGKAAAAAIFTTNRFLAAPVVLSRAALAKSGGKVTGVLINAGCANALTGRKGLNAARRVRARAARLLDCPAEEVFLASTGTIGSTLPEAAIRRALPMSITRLSVSGIDAASRAILTTDAGPKVAGATLKWGRRRGRVIGMAKGAGMIHPDMATMLSFVMTDAPATPAFLKKALVSAADKSFHAISVDGDTSTNDTVLLLASGKLGGPPMRSMRAAADFVRALTDVCRALATMIVRDGEGATRVMAIEIRGARSKHDARLAANAVATSPLVKTALYGGDPNWGRILAAVGRSGARLSTKRVWLKAGNLVLVQNGEPAEYAEERAAQIFAKELVPLVIDLGTGKETASLMTCDLGHDYVTLNADYRT